MQRYLICANARFTLCIQPLGSTANQNIPAIHFYNAMMRKHLDCTTQVIGDDLPTIFLVGVQRHDAIDYHAFSIIVLSGLKHDLFLFEFANTRLLQQRNQQTNRSPAY